MGSLRFIGKEDLIGIYQILQRYGYDDVSSRIAYNPTTVNGDYAELTQFDNEYYVTIYVGDEVYDFNVSSKREMVTELDRY